MGGYEVIRYLLDTNTIVLWLGSRNRILTQRAAAHRWVSAISSIVTHELALGAYHGDRAERTLREYDALDIPVLPFDENDARAAGRIRADLRRIGAPIGPFDTLIAGQALARDLTLVTNNIREFTRVAELHVEDWSQ